MRKMKKEESRDTICIRVLRIAGMQLKRPLSASLLNRSQELRNSLVKTSTIHALSETTNRFSKIMKQREEESCQGHMQHLWMFTRNSKVWIHLTQSTRNICLPRLRSRTIWMCTIRVFHTRFHLFESVASMRGRVRHFLTVSLRPQIQPCRTFTGNFQGNLRLLITTIVLEEMHENPTAISFEHFNKAMQGRDYLPEISVKWSKDSIQESTNPVPCL